MCPEKAPGPPLALLLRKIGWSLVVEALQETSTGWAGQLLGTVFGSPRVATYASPGLCFSAVQNHSLDSLVCQ